MLAIKTNNLTKKFKDKTVVSSLELTIEKGELFSLFRRKMGLENNHN
jgi:ABC-type multidrug transport system ATPase subunit